MQLEELEIDFVSRIGARAFESRDFNRAKDALERFGSLTSLRDKVAALRKEWDDMTIVAEKSEDEQTRNKRRNLGRLRKGQRTPETSYYDPLLKVISNLGSRGSMQRVLDKLGHVMKPVLRGVDYLRLATDPDILRWRNTAQWARNTLVKEGYLKADSPQGNPGN
jgi:restriction system protein